MRAQVAALALSACAVPAPELQPFERMAGATVLATWREAGLPEPNKGRCDVARFAVRVASSARFMEDCRGPVSTTYGCTGWDDTGQLFSYSTYPVVIISPMWHSEPSIIQHELLHAYLMCSGVAPLGDPHHADPRVWQTTGGAASVQARALAAAAMAASP